MPTVKFLALGVGNYFVFSVKREFIQFSVFLSSQTLEPNPFQSETEASLCR